MEAGLRPPSVVGEVAYEIEETLRVVNRGPGQPDKHNLWLALIRDLPPYQSVNRISISPDTYQVMSDEYGNRYAEFDLSGIPPDTEVTIRIKYEVVISELEYDLTGCLGQVLADYLEPELHIESANPQIVELAARLSQGERTACGKARAFYDYVGDNLLYTYNGASWGAQAALGEMGADCTEYASLTAALCRASGIPARYVEGLVVPSVGNAGDAILRGTVEASRTEHAWLEAFLPGTGWVPIDPTLGRFPETRERYFGRYWADHVIVTEGRNPSTLRGASYWAHLYWPGTSTEIRIEGFRWSITLLAR